MKFLRLYEHETLHNSFNLSKQHPPFGTPKFP